MSAYPTVKTVEEFKQQPAEYQDAWPPPHM